MSKTLDVYKQKWELVKDAYFGNGGFETGEYLKKFTRESDDKYNNRKEATTYENIIKSRINKYLGNIYETRPVRASSNKAITTIIDDCDNKGNSLDTFMQNFIVDVKLRGVGLVLIDAPSSVNATNQKEQLDNRELPYIENILPENIVDFKLDKNGKFEYIAFNDTIDNSTYGKDEIVQVIRYYDKTSFKIINGEEIIDSGEHNLGICPVVIFSENGKFPTSGEFTDLGKIALDHYNKKSELDLILREQTFSVLTIQASSTDIDGVDLSVNNALLYPKESSNKPEFIAPSESPSATYEKRLEKLENSVKEATYDIDTSNGNDSGIALQLKYKGLNSSLSSFAQRLEDFELRVFDIIYRYLGDNFDIAINYNKDFNLSDIQAELSILGEVNDITDIPTYKIEKLTKICINDLNPSSEIADKIRSEIEDSFK